MSKLFTYLEEEWDITLLNSDLDEIRNIAIEEAGFKWIPISEREPDEMIDVLLSCVEGEFSGYRVGLTYYSSDCNELEEVAAWMKLPDPYLPTV